MSFGWWRQHCIRRRVEAVNRYRFPTSVRHRLGQQHPQLSSADLDLVEHAARQWFRLLATRPRARLAMPSRVVDDLWHELVLHTRDYAAFCRTAFGHFLHHQPESAMAAAAVAANRGARLTLTARLAARDEGLRRRDTAAAVSHRRAACRHRRPPLPGPVRGHRPLLQPPGADLPATPRRQDRSVRHGNGRASAHLDRHGPTRHHPHARRRRLRGRRPRVRGRLRRRLRQLTDGTGTGHD